MSNSPPDDLFQSAFPPATSNSNCCPTDLPTSWLTFLISANLIGKKWCLEMFYFSNYEYVGTFLICFRSICFAFAAISRKGMELCTHSSWVKVSDSLVKSWTLAVIAPLLALVSKPAEGRWHPQPWGCPTLLKDTRSCSFPKKLNLQKEHGLGVSWTWYYFQAMSFGANYFICLSLSFLIFKMGIERISLFHMAVTKIKWVKGYKAFPQSLTSKRTLVNVSSPDLTLPSQHGPWKSASLRVTPLVAAKGEGIWERDGLGGWD